MTTLETTSNTEEYQFAPSSAQQRMWLLQQLRPDSHQYHIPKLLRIKGCLNVTALEQAVNYLVARHEILRTRFVYENGALYQRCLAQYAVGVDRQDAELSEPEAAITEFATDQYQKLFELSRLPLFRVAVLKLNDADWLLSVTMHHIISDGWSADIFVSELAHCYQAYQQGEPPQLPELPLQYGDYAQWQQDNLNSERHKDDLAYWRKMLSGAPSLALLTDKPRAKIQSLKGALQPFCLPKALADRASAFASAHGLSRFSLYMTAFQLLLSRMCRQQDISVGFPVAGRDHLDTEGLIGLFVNTLVLRTRLDPSLSFKAQARLVQKSILDALEHQHLPFEKLVDELVGERDVSITPLFQVMFAYQSDYAQVQWGELEVETLPPSIDTSKFDLTFSLQETDGQVDGVIEYCRDLFEPDSMEKLAQWYQQLLSVLLGNLERPCSSLPMLDPQAQQALVMHTEKVLRKHESPVGLVECFEQSVERFGQRVALSCDGQTLTYTELNQQANLLAQLIRTRQQASINPASPSIVAICLSPSVDLLVSILAVLKSGAAYLILDPAHPSQRLDYYLLDARVSLLISDHLHAPLLAKLENHPECIWLDDVSAAEDQHHFNPPLASDADSMAYVIYTSGSTGQPKGVCINQGNVLRLFKATESDFAFDQHDVWTLFHSCAFDFSVWEMWGAWLYGGKLVVVPPAISRDPDRFYQLVAQQGITVLNQTPSAFSQFIGKDSKLRAQLSLRYVVFGGEALDFAALRPWIEVHGDCVPKLVNMYGITETTVHVTYQAIDRQIVEKSHGSLIGRPIEDLSIYLLDEHANLVPPGAVGEIYVGGAGLARGYLYRPELTSQRFIDNPLPASVHPRLYRSGDLGRCLPDGSLQYLGRADQQVKIRGFRIELGEIEAVLQGLSMVESAKVVAKSQADGLNQIVAYLVCGEATPTVEQIRAEAAKRLPDYMLPAAFMMLDAMPLTVNGKLDLAALPEPSGLRPRLASRYQAPESDKEQCLCEIWQAVLGIDRIGVLDNFFALGGDSLRAVQVIDQAKRRGLQLTMMGLFQHQTVRALAAEHGATDEELGYRHTAPFSQVSEQDKASLLSAYPDLQDAYPLSQMQAAMFYHMEIAPDSNVYHCTGTTQFQLSRPFDAGAFQAAVQDTVDAHEVYRTAFDLQNFSEPLQLVLPSATLPTQIEDISHLSLAAQNEVILQLLEQERQHPFDLSKPTLLRFFIHLRSPRCIQFTMTECHPVFDGWSYHSMIVEVFNRYEARLSGKMYQQAQACDYRYADFVALEQRILATEAQTAFWRAELQDAQALTLPRMKPQNVKNQVPDIRLRRFTLSAADYQGLCRLMREAEVPMKSVALAAHIKVMNILSGQTDILTGIPANGRPEEIGGDRLAGLFLNTLPYRFKLKKCSWQALCQQVFAQERKLLPYRRYPFAAIQRDAGGQGLLDEVLFNFLDFHVYNELDPELGLTASNPLDKEQVNEGTNFTLSVHFQHLTLTSNLQRKQLSLDIDYDANKLTEQQADLLADTYNAVLSAMARQPGALHLDSELVPRQWQAPCMEQDYPDVPDILALYHAQRQLSADTPVILEADKRLSLSELETQSNRLANFLLAQGVAKGQYIGLMLPRGTAFIVTMLAIVKTGAAYLPLDPDEPDARLQSILTQSAASFVLSHSSHWPAERLTVLAGSTLCCVDEKVSVISAYSKDDPGIRRTAEDPLYLMFTSGSSGHPKGVIIPDRGVVRLLHEADYVPLNHQSRILHLAPVTFDAATFEIWSALLCGCQLAIYPPAVPSIALISQYIREFGITTAFFTTSLFNTLVDEDAEVLAGMQHVLIGGEACSTEHVLRCQQRLPDVQLHNAYGPTECTTFALTHAIAPLSGDQTNGIPIGLPINRTWAKVLDPLGQEVPVGTPGELYLGGDGLALGYLHQEALTNQRFVKLAGRRWYRTGDQVCWLTTGELQFVGRLDAQVKIRGFRIEPGEVEAVLQKIEGVAQAVVDVQGNGSNRHLVAYCVGKYDQSLAEDWLRGKLAEKLPRYMLPQHFVAMSNLPLNVNGKVDRRKLPAPVILEQQDDNLPLSNLAAQVLQTWQSLLGREDIGCKDNFFDVGGHSLLLMRLLQQLRRQGLTLSMLDLLEHPSVDALCQYLQGSEAEFCAQTDVRHGRNRLKNQASQRRSGVLLKE
ncbi:non-ribosomal peptide synthetase [Bowmanella denitrificans]|uniref:non-ribosomal peptide synthetase n=1 Tax=Bowmanella denitrificans TaxID=366582 RepID=UPI000C9A850A|nr:non-ribosomal peptide synthetase [Bowmanella denitrificans]